MQSDITAQRHSVIVWKETHHEFLQSLFISLYISWCSGAQCQQSTSFGVRARFIGLYFTVCAVFSECNCDVSKGPVSLISVAHSPIYFPSSLTFMNSGTLGPNVAEQWNVVYFFYIHFFFLFFLLWVFSSSRSDIMYHTVNYCGRW